jgi:hypothetical protein
MLLLRSATSSRSDVSFSEDLGNVSCALMARYSLASQQSIIINGAIGLQVIVGALTTGVAASGTVHVWQLPSFVVLNDFLIGVAL